MEGELEMGAVERGNLREKAIIFEKDRTHSCQWCERNVDRGKVGKESRAGDSEGKNSTGGKLPVEERSYSRNESTNSPLLSEVRGEELQEHWQS
jgi:hypothetical protein